MQAYRFYPESANFFIDNLRFTIDRSWAHRPIVNRKPTIVNRKFASLPKGK